MRRAGRALLAGLALTLALAAAAPVGAHNRRTGFTGEYGPYDLVASVGDVDRSDGDVIDGVLLELNVRTAGSRRPVDDAVVEVSGEAGDEAVGPLLAERYASAYRVVLAGADVERWDLELRIDGPDGAVTVSEQIAGPRLLHGVTAGSADGPDPSPAWVGAVLASLVGLGLVGLSERWRAVTLLAGGVLLAGCSIALVGAWMRSSAPFAEKALGAVPTLLSGAMLLVGLVLLARRRDDALAPVFAGGAGLAVIVGWVNRAVLTSAEVTSVLSPSVARITTTLALGLGGGVALLVVVRSRDRLRGLLPGPGDRHRAPGTEPEP